MVSQSSWLLFRFDRNVGNTQGAESQLLDLTPWPATGVVQANRPLRKKLQPFRTRRRLCGSMVQDVVDSVLPGSINNVINDLFGSSLSTENARGRER